MQFDFSQIRSFDKSQHNGFEELVCQFAHLEKPDSGKTFVRKEGAGGDAGLECYWVLEDKSEIGWQVKYFSEGMNPSRWEQLDDSFNTAINKHPKLKKFIVALPFNKTDGRKVYKGKKTVSIEDEWQRRLKKWSELARKRGRQMAFAFWGKFELTAFLQKDDPRYSGRALYWFNEPLINAETFKRLTEKTRVSLGERYNEESHVDLPIARRLEGLGLSRHWWEGLQKLVLSMREKENAFFSLFLSPKYSILNKERVSSFQNRLSPLLLTLYNGTLGRDFSLIQSVSAESLNQLATFRSVYDNSQLVNYHQPDDARAIFDSFFNQFYKLREYLTSFSSRAASVKATLVTGPAGIGKSHLLCDLSLQRIDSGLPTVFVPGGHYSGGNPVDLIKRSLDLVQFRDQQVLGTLDAAGEARRERTMIVIDAINEGPHREDWSLHLTSFLQELSHYQHLCLLLSCRSTYKTYILPDTVDENSLIQIEHYGFQGFEHRAAEKYLSKKGIAKPSVPILAPEFTNPLFLKTCCDALLKRKQRAFPKGLRGVSSLFDFYIESVETTMARKKRYRPQEGIVRHCLELLAAEMFPDHLNGIHETRARKLINEHDPSPGRGETLFQELMLEGILSEDIEYETNKKGNPVVRFTYERFSDQFIAVQLLEGQNENTVQELFSIDNPLGALVCSGKSRKIAGVIEALTILLAEKFKVELLDIFGEEHNVNPYLVQRQFIKSLTWRSADSFTDRTLEILNTIRDPNYPRLEVFLQLSTEPDHPWNAERLHKNLWNKPLPERDRFWSVYVAKHDFEEGDGSSESTIRTLIEWSCFGDIKETEPERARLCAIVLTWFLSTPNRKVRDQSTKSLVRLLTVFPDLTEGLLEKFWGIDDLYIAERLISATYGVVSNIDNQNMIRQIALKVFDLTFASGQPVPHLLLRDYARGVLEKANHLKLLPEHIDSANFRPPYNSDWPLENPSEKEIELLIGENERCKIRGSLMGFPGDFGKYTMRCIHDWSPTLLSEPRPQTGRELKEAFAKKYLAGKLKEFYLASISDQYERVHEAELSKKLNDISKASTEELTTILKKHQAEKKEMEDFLKREINALLSDEAKEYFRWLSGLYDDSPASFSRKWAQRWVCKRAYALGWTKELFEDYERSCSYGRNGGEGPGYMERMGKKYQWIALYEFLAHLSDNVHWTRRGMRDDQQTYEGPWQILKRDHDPTLWIRDAGETGYVDEKEVWWKQYQFGFNGHIDLEDQLRFLWSREKVPDFTRLINLKKPGENRQWSILKGSWSQKQTDIEDKDAPALDGWFRVNAVIVTKKNEEKLFQWLQGKYVNNPDVTSIPSNEHQAFFGEYGWHPAFRFQSGWFRAEKRKTDLFKVKHLVPLSEYQWNDNDPDYSLNSPLSFFMPAKEIIEEMGLSQSKSDPGSWMDGHSKTVFFDPSVAGGGGSFALMDSLALKEWLDKHERAIIWLAGGEKMLFGSFAMVRHGRLTFYGVFKETEEGLKGSLTFEEERPETGTELDNKE